MTRVDRNWRRAYQDQTRYGETLSHLPENGRNEFTPGRAGPLCHRSYRLSEGPRGLCRGGASVGRGSSRRRAGKKAGSTFRVHEALKERP